MLLCPALLHDRIVWLIWHGLLLPVGMGCLLGLLEVS